MQQNEEKRIHVTSNPFFAFHDDVFPAFAKNSVSQPQFYRSRRSILPPYDKTIVADNNFTSLEEFEHISTIELKLNGTEMIEFQVRSKQITDRITDNIIECRFFDGKLLFSFGASIDGSLFIDSDYVTQKTVYKSKLSASWTSFELKFESSKSFALEVFEVQGELLLVFS